MGFLTYYRLIATNTEWKFNVKKEKLRTFAFIPTFQKRCLQGKEQTTPTSPNMEPHLLLNNFAA